MPMPTPAALQWLRLSLSSQANVPAADLVLAAASPRAADESPRDVASRLETLVDERIFSRQPHARSWDESLRWLEDPGNMLLVPTDPRYPQRLRQIPGPALALFVQGRAERLGAPCIAIVGSRNATPSGCSDARAFAAAFAERGLCVVSGMAAGIDAAAHRGALSALGKTIAVMGTGPDIVYPEFHQELHADIREGGCVMTEFPPTTPPDRWNFPRRNRLISGLSLGVLVVEAARQSGSLITARLAGDQGRDVFAMPGSVHAPQARGCHELLRQGAKLVECADDVFEELGPEFRRPPRPQRASVALAPYGPILEAMGYAPISPDQIAGATGEPITRVVAELTRLQLQGIIDAIPGGRFQRNPGREEHTL